MPFIRGGLSVQIAVGLDCFSAASKIVRQRFLVLAQHRFLDLARTSFFSEKQTQTQESANVHHNIEPFTKLIAWLVEEGMKGRPVATIRNW